MNAESFFARMFAAACGLMLFGGQKSAMAAATSAPCRIEVLLDEEIGVISPNVYGHFVENLSGVVYDGIWVGPLEGGQRRRDPPAAVEEMRKIKPPLVRFPGGCFADSYDWRDGIGPPDKRPRRTNFWDEYETNCPGQPSLRSQRVRHQRVRALLPADRRQSYLAANLRSLPAEEFARWVEYCNSPAGSTTLADMRAAAGFQGAARCALLGSGQRLWGCGGNFTPQGYASEFRRYAAWVPTYGQSCRSSPRVRTPTTGPGHAASSRSWCARTRISSIACMASRCTTTPGTSVAGAPRTGTRARGTRSASSRSTGTRCCARADRWRPSSRVTGRSWASMTPASVKLVVDEWAPWYRPGSEATPGDLFEQTPTLRDAVFSGMTLDTFNRHPERSRSPPCAQLVNCLNSLYLAHEDRFVVTPGGPRVRHVRGAPGRQGVRSSFSAPAIRYQRDGKPCVLGVEGLGLDAGKSLTLTVVNPHVGEPRNRDLAVRRQERSREPSLSLANSDIHAYNSFQHRDVVVLRTSQLKVAGATLVLTFPPASVTTLQIDMG